MATSSYLDANISLKHASVDGLYPVHMVATKLLAAKPAWSDRDHVIRTLHTSKNDTAGALLALETYGGELHAFLAAAAQHTAQADAAYAELCHDVWRSFVMFRWGASLRTWLYVLAYEALLRIELRVVSDRPRTCYEVDALLDRARAASVRWQYTGLRERLDREERALLVLKIDRNLSWKDVVEVLDIEELSLRMRLDKIKTRVKTLAREANVPAQASFARVAKRSLKLSRRPDVRSA